MSITQAMRSVTPLINTCRMMHLGATWDAHLHEIDVALGLRSVIATICAGIKTGIDMSWFWRTF